MTYWTAVDPGGDMCLWSGTGPGDPDCQPVANKRLLDRDDTALWHALVAQLITTPYELECHDCGRRYAIAAPHENYASVCEQRTRLESEVEDLRRQLMAAELAL
jgi:hypothetical protein